MSMNTERNTNMAKLNDIKDSNYLAKEDCEPNLQVTVSHCVEEDVSMANQPTRMKHVLYFQEQSLPKKQDGQTKGMVLNLVNFQRIAQLSGRDDTDNWKGVQFTLYNDPTVDFGGKLVGGIRVWVPQVAPPGMPPQAPVQQQPTGPGTPTTTYRGENPPPPADADVPFDPENPDEVPY